MLVIACVVIAGSFSLRVQSDDQVGLFGLSEFVLPPLCLSRACFGVQCPGCGLTRSFIFLAQGNWQSSWESHHLGWLLAVLVLLQIPYRIHGLLTPRSALIPSKTRFWIAQTLIALLIGNWLIGLLN
jgi:hypothetical protein